MTTPTDRAKTCALDLADDLFISPRDRDQIALFIARHFAIPEGHVMLPTGEVVKVLGELPMTADGCIMAPDGKYMFWGYAPVPGEGPRRPVYPIYAPTHPQYTYSTREAAIAARDAKENA